MSHRLIAALLIAAVSTAAPATADDSLQRVLENGVLKVGAEPGTVVLMRTSTTPAAVSTDAPSGVPSPFRSPVATTTAPLGSATTPAAKRGAEVNCAAAGCGTGRTMPAAATSRARPACNVPGDKRTQYHLPPRTAADGR